MMKTAPVVLFFVYHLPEPIFQPKSFLKWMDGTVAPLQPKSFPQWMDVTVVSLLPKYFPQWMDVKVAPLQPKSFPQWMVATVISFFKIYLSAGNLSLMHWYERKSSLITGI